jgi:hypothetical protein
MKETTIALLRRTKEPIAAALIAGGVWLAGRIDVAVAIVDAKISKIESRLEAIETALKAHHLVKQ